MKRTFQVAVFGASNAANLKIVTGLQRARGGELVTIPTGGDTITRFFDYDVERGGDRTRIRIRMVTCATVPGQAFLGLIGSNAVVFVPGGRQADAWREMEAQLRTYGARPVMIAADRPARGLTGEVVGAGGAKLAEGIERVVLAAFRAGTIQGSKTTEPSKAYVARATTIAAAATIALEVGPRQLAAFHEGVRAMALHPELGFARVSSLASLEADLFTYWNEARGAHVDRFWRAIAARKLPYRRRDVVADVLERGRISNRGDYDTIVDRISDPGLSAAQRKRLDAMLAAYGRRSR